MILKSQHKRLARHPNQHHIKKRHWALGAAVILAGSWITHTTTATISGVAPQGTPVGIAEVIASDATRLRQDEMHLDGAVQLAVNQVPKYQESSYTVRKGDTIGGIFKKLDFNAALPHQISEHDIANQLVSLGIGRELVFRSDDAGLRELEYAVNKLQRLKVHFEGEEIVGAEVGDLPFEIETLAVSSEINSSLYEAALDAGLSNGMIMEMVRIFGWDVDFVQDIRQGDSFHLVYEEYRMDGDKLSDGNIIAAEFNTQDQSYRALRFEDEDGQASFYNPDGDSMLGTFLRSPVEFSRISSRFGKRKHPISKKWRAHKGVDYAAARGTPIRATADGKVVLAGRKGGYGKTVVIRHAGRFSTLYGHMNGYARGIRSGAKVKQGDVIGYVGSTGYSTGPHLHYEFRVDGVHRNPLTYKTPKASSVKQSDRTAFAAVVDQWSAKLDQLGHNYRLAHAKVDDASSQAF